MSVEYISDNEGKTKGVFIPIEEWNILKKQYSELFENEYDIPKWHEQIVEERLEEYNKAPDNVLDLEKTLNEIKKEISNSRA